MERYVWIWIAVGPRFVMTQLFPGTAVNDHWGFTVGQILSCNMNMLFARWRHCLLPHRWLRQVKSDIAMEVGYDESFRPMRGMEGWAWDSMNYAM